MAYDPRKHLENIRAGLENRTNPGQPQREDYTSGPEMAPAQSQGMDPMAQIQRMQTPMGGMDKRNMGAPAMGRPDIPRMVRPEIETTAKDALGEKPIGKKELDEAVATLTKYKQGKQNLEERIVQDELWWELRHWEIIRRQKGQGEVAPTSAWLFNTIVSKHADAMDNYPEPVVLPRERSDEEAARTLSAVLPVIMESNNFEQVNSDAWWEKLKHGTAAYGVFWDQSKENGLGDISIRGVDLLKIFWEPGITDLQASRNLFVVELVDEDLLDKQYPQYAGKMGGTAVDVKQYLYDETIDISGKSLVIDWYYKVKNGDRTVLHYVKFVGGMEEPLFASENDPDYAQTGWYDHGMYPIVLDVLFPEKGTPVGFGMVAICKDPQMYIDNLSAGIMENALISTRLRYFISDSCGISEEEMLDMKKVFVHVQGELNENRIQPIVGQQLNDLYVSIMNMKVEEMKDTASNRDVNTGGGGSVTAASAIAALQEAGNKVSRDMISTGYRATKLVAIQCLELIRQFYSEARAFRVTGQGTPGGYDFVSLDNSQMRDQVTGIGPDGQELFRRPIFDLKIKAQKTNPFSRMEQNERAKELYSMGFFNPERAQEAIGALEMMDFEGIDKVKEQAREGQTLMNMVQQLNMQVQQMAQQIAMLTGQTVTVQQPGMPQGGQPQGQPQGGGPETNAERMTRNTMEARTPMTSYGQQLAERSKPKVEGR